MTMTSPRAPGRKVLVIHNPTSGWRRIGRLRSVIDRLRALGCEVDVRPTLCAGDATRLAREGSAHDYDVIVAAGGDGTINEVANGLRAGGPPLGVIPLGTANILAWEIGLGRRTERVARTIAIGEPRPVVVGRIGERKFLLMVGVGYDGAVVAAVSTALKRRLGKGAYVAAGLAQMARYRWPTLKVVVDGVEQPCAMAIIAKAHYYAGRFVLAEDAGPEEPLFRVCLFRGGGIWNLVRYGIALLLGRLDTLDDVTIVTARDIVIANPTAVPVQADGECLGMTPVNLTIADEGVPLLWPVR
jgi:YegS/Rv2252/BmrU family lipid kinase